MKGKRKKNGSVEKKENMPLKESSMIEINTIQTLPLNLVTLREMQL